ncbi:MAG TPA: pirin family protein [Candidatus Binatia bacterium]|nr:pirin family protein [Candidatus Binatia bacterium]
MIRIRKSAERGHGKHGWLDTRHTFSFAEYYDPQHMGFRALRVINDDRVAPSMGFPSHPHRDMEILTYVLAGVLAHEDSMGNGSVVPAGDVQRMSAGTGIVHSEVNASPSEPLHLLQIWILPERQGLPPSYEQKTFPETEKRARLRRVVSRDGADGSVSIHQDVDVYATLIGGGQTVRHALRPGRHAWVQVAEGGLTLNGLALDAGDGAAVSGEVTLELGGGAEPAEALLFDLP